MQNQRVGVRESAVPFEGEEGASNQRSKQNEDSPRNQHKPDIGERGIEHQEARVGIGGGCVERDDPRVGKFSGVCLLNSEYALFMTP